MYCCYNKAAGLVLRPITRKTLPFDNLYNVVSFSFSLFQPVRSKYQIGGTSTAFMMGSTKIKLHEHTLTNKSYGLANQRFAFVCLFSSQTRRNVPRVVDKKSVFEQGWDQNDRDHEKPYKEPRSFVLQSKRVLSVYCCCNKGAGHVLRPTTRKTLPLTICTLQFLTFSTCQIQN